MIKNYLLSISNEAQDNYKVVLKTIKTRITEEVFKTPLQSSYLLISSIIKEELENFVDKLENILSYYSEGIYYNGKTTARKKLKLDLVKNKGEKYSFTTRDRIVLDKFIQDKLKQFENMMKYSSVGFVTNNVTEEIRKQWNINEESGTFQYTKQELVDDEIKEMTEIILQTITSIYDEILEVSISEMIALFKRGQLEEFKSLGINKLTLNSTRDCCPVCKVRSTKVLSIESLEDDFSVNKEILHPFCNFSLEPVINYDDFNKKSFNKHNLSEQSGSRIDNMHLSNEIKVKNENLVLGKLVFQNVPIEVENRLVKMFSRIRIFLSEFIKPINFKFVDDITNENEWFNSLKKQNEIESNEFEASNKTYIEQDNSRGLISTFRLDNTVFISDFALLTDSIEDIVIREIFRGIEIPNKNWWSNKIEDYSKDKQVGEGFSIKKSVFVNYLSRNSLEDFILESIVFYVNDPYNLLMINKEVFYKLKSDLFNGVQFY